MVATHFTPIMGMQKSAIAVQANNNLNKSAKDVSVRINTSTEINSSRYRDSDLVFTTQFTTGIIVHRNQDLFSVVVNKTITSDPQWLTTSDGQSHKITAIFNDENSNSQQQLSLVQFRSSKNYPIAKISKTNKLLRRGDEIYISSVKTGVDHNPFGDFKIYSGQVATNRQGSFLYDNIPTAGGLPIGGAIFNKQGELVGFHNQNKWSINDEDPRDGYSGYPHISLSSLYLLNDVGLEGPECGVRTKPRRTVRDKYNSGTLIKNFSQLAKKANFSLPPEKQALADSNATLVEDYIAIAISLDKNYKINESIRALNAAIEIEPQNADLYSLRGMALEGLTNNSLSALFDYDRAIQLNPNDSLSLFMRIKNSQSTNQWPDYESLLRLNPNSEVLHYRRGEFKRFSENPLADALPEFDQMVAANPSSAKSYLARGIFKEYGLEDFQGALADYKKLASLENHAAAYDILIQLQENKIKDFPGALASYNQALKLKGGSEPYSRFAERRAQLKQNQLHNFTGALADYNQMISIDPYNFTAYQLRAELKATKLNDINGALSDLDTITKLAPTRVDGYTNKAEFKANRMGSYIDALSDYNKAISISPEDHNLYILRAELKSGKLNDLTGALQDYALALKLNSGSSNTYISRAKLKSARLNDLTGALADYDQAITVGKIRDNYYLRAEFKVDKLHDLSGAHADYDAAIVMADLDPNSSGLSEAYSKRAEFKINKLKDFLGALADYDKSIDSLSNDNYDAYYSRGVLKLTKFQDRAGAIADFKQYTYSCKNNVFISETCQKNQENIQRYLADPRTPGRHSGNLKVK